MSNPAAALLGIPTTNCDRFRCPPSWTRTLRDNALPADQEELWLVWAGHGELHTTTGSYEIRPGFCAWFRPEGRYEVRQDESDPLGLTSIHFRLQKKQHESTHQYPEFFDVWDLNYVDSITQRIVEIMRQRQIDDAQKRVASLLLSGVLLDLTQRFHYQRKPAVNTVTRDHRAMARQLVRYIHDSTGSPVTVGDLARKAGYSVAHFSTIFKRMTGQTAESMIVQARIDKARRLLRWSDCSISEVAATAGYPDIYFFSRQFKLKTGVTPTEYRSARHEDRLELLHMHAEPLLHRNSPGALDVKHGFEGGRVVKLRGTYHLFTAEMASDPKNIATRLAHWTSPEGLHWTRASTLFTSDGTIDGQSSRAALWSPSPVYDPATKAWHLFYIAFRAQENTRRAWFTNYDGHVYHAISSVPGLDGIGGPYRDQGVVMMADEHKQPWEGLKGVSSFFPYQVGSEWYAFYGSAKTQQVPCGFWGVGLAKATAIGGPWKRLRKGNPVSLDAVFAENPVVTALPDGGGYVLVFDGGHRGAVGYSFSADGIHWPQGKFLLDRDSAPSWLKVMRTPLGALLEEDGRVYIFFTGYDESHYANLGLMQVRLLTAQHTTGKRRPPAEGMVGSIQKPAVDRGKAKARNKSSHTARCPDSFEGTAAHG